MADNLVVTTGAAEAVPVTQAQFLEQATEAIDEARTALDEMLKRQYIRSYSPRAGEVPNYNIGFNPLGDIPKWTYNANLPQWQNIALNLDPVIHNDVEDFTGDAPATVSPNIPIAPNVSLPGEPGDAPEITDTTLPDVPELKTIEDPKEWAISLPVSPDITIPSFISNVPSIGGINPPTGEFTWSEAEYDSELLRATTAKISLFMEGGVGIPDQVWEALWQKDNDRENRAGVKLVDEVNEEWSDRGFGLFQGIQISQVKEIYQALQSSTVSRSRDIAIREGDLAIENLRFAVQQGIALENLKGSWYQQALTRILEASKFTYQLQLDIFNAEVSFYNTQLQAYIAEAQVYKTQIEGEIAKLDVYKTELEGQRLIGDLNQQQVDIYATKIKSLQTTIDLYNAELQGVKLGVDIDVAKIDAYKASVQAYGEKIKAISIEYDIYNTKMQGAKIEADIYDVNVRAFAGKVSAYTSKVDAEAKNATVAIETNKVKLQEYTAKIDAFTSSLNASVEELKANTIAFDAEHKEYLANVDYEKVRIDTQISELQQGISYASQRTQVSISGASDDLRAAVAEAQLSLEAMKQISNVESNLAGSAMSAINVSQSISDSAGNSAQI